MKLRVKLSLMTGAALLFAAMLFIGLSFSMSRRTILSEAGRSAYAQSEAAFQSFENYCGRLAGGAGVQSAVYWLKSQEDEYTILLRDDEVCYNRTVLDPLELSENSPPRYGPQEAGLYRGRRLLVYRFDSDARFVFIHLVDVTDTYMGLYRLAAGQGLLSVIILAVAAAAVFYMLRRALKPLQALSDSANAIAAGAYDRRAPEEGRDELSGLGRDFNRMAAAVEEHIRRVEESEEFNRVRHEQHLSGARVTVEWKDGTRDSAVVTRPKGALGNPLSREDVVEKYSSLAAAALGRERAQELRELVLEGAEETPVARLLRLLEPVKR